MDNSSQVAGTIISHYRIVSKIGAGGMGEVYLAEDAKLERRVAIKLLPPESVADGQARRRLVHEAKAAAKLDHPNICSIYEVGESDGQSFIVMKYVEGETLASRVDRKPVELPECLDIAVQVADALAEAHAHGIVHRDIKPQNIMITARRQATVMDFGLAKIVTARDLSRSKTETQSLLTEPGMILGTVPYMSAEQVRGEALDGRSDIFSFGAVLYEMVSGRHPFAAESAAATASAILTKEPLPLARYAPDAPAELQRIVRKCLEKDREHRYQSARDLAIDLRNLKRAIESGPPAVAMGDKMKWRTLLTTRGALGLAGIAVLAIAVLIYALLSRGAPAPVQLDIKSLAVLPFKSLNQETKEDYLGLGIATDIITKISQSGELTVRPTSAVRKYVNQEMDALEAAREQKVDAVLDSTFLHVGDKLRVSVNLLRVIDGVSLWAENFDERFTDIFSIQDKVSQQVAQRLRLKLNPSKQARLTKRYTSNPEAYNYYAKAVYHFENIRPDLNTRPEADLAIDLFHKAISLDLNYALAHAQLGNAYARIAVFLEDNPALIEQAKQELATAERLDPQLAEVHDARYFIAFSQYEGWQVETAIRELRLAKELDPNVGHSGLADLYHHIGLEKQQDEENEIALTVDPNNDRIKEGYVGQYFQSARPDEGLAARERFFNRGPDRRYYLEKSMVKEAGPLVEQAYQQNPGDARVQEERALLLALQGKHPEAQAAVPLILEKARKNRGYHHLTYDLARIYALGGKIGEALKWLRVTVKEGFPCYPLFARDPFLDPIRQDPAFVLFLEEMKTRWKGYQREFG